MEHKKKKRVPPEKLLLSDEEWKRRLSGEQYQILREKGTEPPFCNPFWDHKKSGTYVCAACGLPLFVSEDKYDSQSGWPSFLQPKEESHLIYIEDFTLGISRIEVLCAACEGHLGHVFEDGPPPTNLRYCINSHALKFIPKKEEG